MKKILVVGCGGIGSKLIKNIDELMSKEQIKINEVELFFMDNDIVEKKNLLYQEFEVDDLGKNKAEVLANRYLADAVNTNLERHEQLIPYDIIVLAVDNNATRNLVYDYCYDRDKYFIDLRAEGRSIAYGSKCEKRKEMQYNTLGKELVRTGSSCQMKYELEQGIIQYGNVVVATIGAQMILNKLRGEENVAFASIRI